MNSNEMPMSGQEDVIDLRKLFYKVIAKWRWFVVSVPLCLVAALFYCVTRIPVYDVNSKVMISDTKKGELGTSVMMKELGFLQGDMYVENEMIELQSKNLMKETVQDLELNIHYTSEGLFRDRELYKNSPVKILIDQPGCIKDTCINITLGGTDEITVTDMNNTLVYKGHFSESIPMGEYCISIEKNEGVNEGVNKIRVHLDSYDTATKTFYKQLTVTPLEKNTNAVRVSVKDAIPERGKELILALIDRYNKNGIADKQVVSAKTVEFINARLEVINRELGTIENDAERFKRTNKLTNITSDAQFVMERKKQAGIELLKLQTELDVVRSIRVLMEKRENEAFSLLPENMGVTDEGLNNAISRYNEMLLRRNKLLLSASENNPIVSGLDKQLKEIKSSIQEAMGNVESGLLVQINTLQRENHSVDERLTSVPTQEKQYRAIARQQELKENLFLFLMQKREEAEIAKLIYVSTAKIIEDPDAGGYPISPKKALILLLGFVMGMGAPVALILGKELMDNKVRNIEDVERAVQLPLLGAFPEIADGKVRINEEDFMLAESMHLIREKLNYMLKQRVCPVVMVTSTISAEGKSLIASHLANAYAKTSHKTLVIGCDLRNPSLHLFLEQNNHIGLSAYLAGLENDVNKLIVPINDNLHVLFGGAVPPNPVQLIASPRMKELLDRLKSSYSCIILDTPPLGILSEGFSLSKLTDACVYVVRANVLRKDALKLLADFGKEGRLPDIGILLNGVRSEPGGYRYGYGYGYSYGYNYLSNKKKHDRI